MFKEEQLVLVTDNWEDNNTKGKLGIILKKTNGYTKAYQEKYSSIKSTWWVNGHVLKRAISKNKFK